MKRFLLLYDGPPTPSEASHEGWPAWFDKIGDALVDLGSPMPTGTVVRGDGTTTDSTASLNGYSIVQAEDIAGVLDLVRDHPFLRLGREYAIQVFEVPKR